MITKPNYYKYGIFVKDQNGKWFAKWDDTYARNEVLTINNVKYGFNDTGVLCEGWVQHNNKWYYTYASGIVKTDKWQSYKGKWYYLKSDGQMAINEKTPDGYMVDINGVYQESGQISRQWKRNSVGWWIQNPDGSYPRNEIVEMNGSDYGFDSEGYMYTGWFKLNESWYYADSSGKIMKNFWKKTGSNWYYLKYNGKMAVEEKTPDGYYIDINGICIS